MDFSGKYFIYDGIDSHKYDLRFLHIDTDAFTQMAADKEYETEHFNPTHDNFIKSTSHTEPMEFEVEILRQDPIPYPLRREISSWLFNKDTSKKLYISEEEDCYRSTDGSIKKTYIECVFYNPSVISVAGGVRGWKATMLVTSNMAKLDEMKINVNSFQLNSSSGRYEAELNIDCDSDLSEFIFPKFDVEINNYNQSITDLQITNTSIDSSFKYYTGGKTEKAPKMDLEHVSVMYAYMDGGIYDYFLLDGGVRHTIQKAKVTSGGVTYNAVRIVGYGTSNVFTVAQAIPEYLRPMIYREKITDSSSSATKRLRIDNGIKTAFSYGEVAYFTANELQLLEQSDVEIMKKIENPDNNFQITIAAANDYRKLICVRNNTTSGGVVVGVTFKLYAEIGTNPSYLDSELTKVTYQGEQYYDITGSEYITDVGTSVRYTDVNSPENLKSVYSYVSNGEFLKLIPHSNHIKISSSVNLNNVDITWVNTRWMR